MTSQPDNWQKNYQQARLAHWDNVASKQDAGIGKFVLAENLRFDYFRERLLTLSDPFEVVRAFRDME